MPPKAPLKVGKKVSIISK